jgi:hypothetical protein
VVLSASGKTTEGKDLISKGLSLKPYMDTSLVTIAKPFIGQ